MKTTRAFFLFIMLFFASQVQAQVPVLSSYPSARAVIFLDFDGHNVSGTGWNVFGFDIPCAPADLNADQIAEIFNRVAEDYRPFNVNITTDSTKFLAAPLKQRTRVILTPTSSWYGSAGGVAWTGSFSWGDDTPCFVFSTLLLNNPKYVAEAASHEIGHTLGLFHQAKYDADCLRLDEYDTGHGTGEIGWAPIMGKGYYKNFTIWHNGPNNFGCNNLQNDLAIITSTTNGFGYRPDDNGNSFATATQPVFSSNQFNVTGVIQENTDLDYFKFIMPGTGRFQLDAIPYNVGTGNAGSDLDMQVTLYNESKTALSIYNPGALLNSVADTILNAGTYYLKVEGKGNLNASSYASLGSYSMQGRININETVLPVNRLELRGIQNGDLHQLSWLITTDKTLVQQILEVSTDGREFTALVDAPINDRQYIYRPPGTQPAYYRLISLFSDGHRYYSNTVRISSGDINLRPKLAGNLIQTNDIYISSPGKYYTYSIIDMNGREIRRGQLTTGMNHIHIPSMPAGIYIVRMTGNDQQWTDKLVRE